MTPIQDSEDLYLSRRTFLLGEKLQKSNSKRRVSLLVIQLLNQAMTLVVKENSL